MIAEKLERTSSPLDRDNLIAVQFQNGIGNFIMMTPAIKAVAEQYTAKVDIVLDKSWTDSRRKGIETFCDLWELVDEVIEFQNGFDKDKYVQLFYAYHGENSEAHTFFKKNAEFESDHVNWRADKLHEIDYYMNMAFNMGYRGPIPSQQYVKGANVFRNDIIDSEYMHIGLCNGFFAGSRFQWERKGWPYFHKLVKLLRTYYKGKIKIFLFGKGLVEEQWAEEIAKEPQVINTVSKCDLPEVTSLMYYMNLFITTDTGLMHIADSLEIPTVALFGATLVSKNGLYNKEHRVVRSALSCVPCQLSPHFEICRKWECMEKLTPEIVMSEVRSYVCTLIKEGKLNNRKEGGEVKSCLL